ncbi:sirohydrochlorin chelatase [Pseudonocardia spinosispora]|uniref:sirohydrochlorin chelatase n=1 Tax=Pseudonocardia spinosispora TaxID=103441 RepID=UPI0003F64BEB|nr:sirohydrochlorin chelatase [Pseudonocardia spinosispora]
MHSPALVAVAHGSRDPSSAATIAALMDEVRRQRPDLDVRLSFLDLNTPRLPEVLEAVASAGHRSAIVVPLLLGSAFHARVDLPGIVSRSSARLPLLDIRVASVLGNGPLLVSTLLGRLASVVPGPLSAPDLGVVLAATGSSRPAANQAVHELASSLARSHRWRSCVAAFATGVSPSVPRAVSQLQKAGAGRIAVASWFLAPGLLSRRVSDAALSACPSALIAPPLGADPSVASLVVSRYLDAFGEPARAVG